MFRCTSQSCFGFGAPLAAAAFAAALVPATSAQAQSHNACYEVTFQEVEGGPDPAQFIRYVATPQGRLAGFGEQHDFGHPLQTTYTVHGKSTFVPDNGEQEPIGILDGTAVVGRNTGAAIAFQRDFLEKNFFDKIDCVSESEEASATPEAWLCELIIAVADDANPLRVGNDLRLVRVDSSTEEACSNFSLVTE